MTAECLATAEGAQEREKVSPETRANDLMNRGRSLAVGETFNQEAFNLLSKAIKLNPYLIEAWIELTRCYQMKHDIDGAIACLENALRYCDADKPNKIILRNLSTCVRQKDFDNQEAKIAALFRSLDLSKQALKSDLHDEENYYNLAKAYMCLFFATACIDQQLINLSRAAYSKALALSLERQTSNSDKSFTQQSDFLFNYSTVLVYLQEFQSALEYLELAVALDPWSEPKGLEESLIDYLKQIDSMLGELCKSKKKMTRKYSKIVESLSYTAKIEELIESDKRCKLTRATLDDISKSEKSTETSILHLKFLNAINYNQTMYLTFIAIDRDYEPIVVTIYNLAASKCPTQRDIVTIVDPKVDEVSVDCKKLESKVFYKRLNVREFRCVYVNGNRLSTEQVSKPQYKVSVMP